MTAVTFDANHLSDEVARMQLGIVAQQGVPLGDHVIVPYLNYPVCDQDFLPTVQDDVPVSEFS
jgi:hypothetical protein